MEQVINLLKSNFVEMGDAGVNLGLFAVAFLYLLFTKNKGSHRYLIYLSMLWILVLNPLTFNNITTFWFFDDYWKLFAVLMPAVGIAYAFVELIVDAKGIWVKCLMVFSCIFFVALSERFVFEPVKLALPETTLGVTEELVELDTILCSSEIPVCNVIAPVEVITHIREIDANIQLLYSGELIERMIDNSYMTESEEEKQFIMHCASVVSAPLAVENQINVAELYGSNCIVLNREYDNANLMGSRGFTMQGTTENYVVYIKDAYEN